MYKTIRTCLLATAVKVTAFGPSVTKIAPLKSTTDFTVTDRGKQLERWAEHYQGLYSRETIITQMAVQNTTPLFSWK